MNVRQHTRERRAAGRAVMLAIFIGLCSMGTLHSQVFDWAQQIVGQVWKHGRAIAIDNDGYAFVVGEFSGLGTYPLLFGEAQPYDATLAPNDGVTAFIAMYSPTGHLEWVEPLQASSGGIMTATDVAVWNGGGSYHVYIGGQISGSATLGLPPNQQTTLTASNGGCYIAEYTYSHGQNPWVFEHALACTAKTSTSSIRLGGIAVDSHGNPHLCGTLTGSGEFPGRPSPTLAPGQSGLFVAKLDVVPGATDWTTKWLSYTINCEAQGSAIAIDQNDNAVVVGQYHSGTLAYSTPHPPPTLTNNLVIDHLLIARCSATGNGAFDLAKEVSSGGGMTATDIAVRNGMAYVVGSFNGTATFTPGVSQPLAGPARRTDYVLAKFDLATGQWSWAKCGNVSTYGEAIATSVAVGNNSVAVTGTFFGAMDFHSAPQSRVTISSMGNHDIFVASHNISNGEIAWAQRAGNGYGNTNRRHYDQGTGVAVQQGGSDLVYIVGEFGSDAADGAHDATFVGTEGLGFSHMRNGVVAKFRPDADKITGTVKMNSIPAANQVLVITITHSTLPPDFVMTAPDGTYTAYIPAGSIATVQLLYDPALWSCLPATPPTVSGLSSPVNFDLTAGDILEERLEIEMQPMTSENALVNRDNEYLITYRNVGNKQANGFSIHLDYSGLLQSPPIIQTSQGLAQPTIVGNDIKWLVPALLNPMQSETIMLTCRFIDPHQAETMLEMRCRIVDLNGAPGRSGGVLQSVVQPSDPNGKTVAQARNLSVVRVRAGIDLYYTVAFTNIGNGNETDVDVLDNLDPAIDLTVGPGQLMGAWPFGLSTTAITPSTVFTFSSTVLPPIVPNPGSVGFIGFSVPLGQGTPIGTWVRNRAWVMFQTAGSTMGTNVVENCVAADFTVDPGSMYAGGTTQFATDDGNGTSYLPDWASPASIYWQFGDGNTATGNNPTHTYGSAGTYRVTLTFTDRDGTRRWLCDQYESEFRITKLVRIAPASEKRARPPSDTSVTSMPLNDSGAPFTIRPNPGIGIFTLVIDGSDVAEERYEIIDMRGNVVREGRIAPGACSAAVDMGKAPAGVYIARLKAGGQFTTYRFIVQH